MFELFQMWALVEVLGLVCLPLTFTVFHNLPDRGWAFSKALALAVFAFCVWLPLMSLQFLPFSQFFIIGVAFVLLVCSLLSWLRAEGIRRDLVGVVRSNLFYIIATELIFLGMVFLLGWLRSFRPDIYTNEMFMDEGFIASLLRSPHLPPNDMWLAGHSLNYYYYAHFSITILAKLLGQSAAVAFNTGISIFFGLTAVTLFGVTCNIVAWAQHLRTRQQTGQLDQQPYPPLLRAIPYGFLSILMALVLGNLAATQQWFQNHGDAAHFDWYNPSRVIPHTINEFPAFSFLLACFHAHVLTLAFTILAIGLAFSLFLEKDGKGIAAFGHGWQQRLFTVVTSALVLGALFVMNSWDYPTYMGLALICIALQQWMAHQMRLEPGFFVGIVTTLLPLVGLSFLLYLPFYLNFVSPTQGIGLVTAKDSSQISDELLIYGLFGFVFLSLMLASAAKSRLFVRTQTLISRYLLLGILLGILVMLIIWAMLIFLFVPNGLTFVVIGGIAILAAILVFLHIEDRSHAFILLLGAIAFALIALCEVFYLRDLFEASDPRMNTIFKFYFQAWALLSIACSSGLYFIFESFRPFKMASQVQRWSLRGLQAVWSVGLLLLLLAGSVYPLLAPIARYALYNPVNQGLYWQHNNSLNGLDYLATCSPPTCQYDMAGDYTAIRWLNANVQGDPVIVESSGGDYTEYGRVSAFTGLPTIMGWYGHEIQWRVGWLLKSSNAEDMNRRISDLDQIYTNPNSTQVLAMMARYHAQYLYVGTLENIKYSPDKYPGVDLHRFNTFMQVVYDADGVVIYKVK